jgi:altronate hydrolase
MPLPYLKIHPDDNVAVQLVATAQVPLGHKRALRTICSGSPVVKYGAVIGIASVDIPEGAHVHIHNLRSPSDRELTEALTTGSSKTGSAPYKLATSFLGYKRDSGRAGTRNVIVVVATVNCAGRVARLIARQFDAQTRRRADIDRVVALTHTMGCAQEIGGSAFAVLNRTLAGSIAHPNVVGALVVGLGCEQTTVASIVDAVETDRRGLSVPLRVLSIQQEGGTEAAIRRGVAHVQALIDQLPNYAREPVSVDQLVLATNCGGSDAFSGLTANPILGRVTEWLSSRGGSSVLAEVPECHGAEGLLLSRCRDIAVRSKLEGIFKWWSGHLGGFGSRFNHNLALGNLEGGLSTIVEKSLGAVSKAGRAPITDVLEYAEPVRERGLAVMNTPGFDPVSVTGLVAGGCNVVAFTTGRGSTFGNALAPTLKLATTSRLFRHMTDDMDFDAGPVLEGETVEMAAGRLWQCLIETASGRPTRSEVLGFGEDEFVPWNVGATL